MTEPILALHCMLASGAAWRGVRAALPGRTMICPDLPGHGTDGWDGTGAYMDAALDLAWAVAPEGPIDVVGHSYGGCVALRMLAEEPGRIRSLTLIEPVMFAAAPEAERLAHARDMAGFHAELEAGKREAAARRFTGLWGAGRAWDALSERQRSYITDRIHLIAASGPGIVDDVHGILDRLPTAPPPVTIVTRQDPPPITEGIARGLAARLPGAQVRRLGHGHMIPMERPAETAALLR